MVLYHGTVLAFANAIHSKGIDTEKNAKSELDFGKGLYVSDIETATVFAFKKVAEIKSWDDIPDESFLIPAIVPIEINEAEFSLLDIKKLEKKDIKWLRFVYNTRRYHLESKHDVIMGAIADGAIDEIMSRIEHLPTFIAKIIAYSHFLRRENKGHMQYVLKTAKAVAVVHTQKPIPLKKKGDD